MDIPELCDSIARTFAAGELIFEPQRIPESIYLLESGLVRIYRVSSSGSVTSFGYVSRQQFFGELAGLGDYPRESYADAIDRSQVRIIPRKRFQRAIAAHPGLLHEVARQMGERLKRIERRVENLNSGGSIRRLAIILTELAEDFGRYHDGVVRIDIPLTQEMLSTLIGASRQTTNAGLRDLARDALIDVARGRIHVNDLDALRHVAGIKLADVPEAVTAAAHPLL